MHNRYMLEAFEDYYQFHEKESVDQIADSLSQFFEDTEQDNHYLLGAAGKVGDWGLMQHYAGRIHELTLQERHILMLYQQLAVTDMDLGRNLSAQAARAVHDLFLNLLHIDGESAASRAAAELLPRPLQQCLLRYWGGDMPLTESQVSDYLSVLPAIIQAGNRDMLQRYIRLAADFSCIGRLAVGRCLYQHEAWEAAAEVYEGLSGGSGLETAFWQEKGIIAMHRGERATALEAFQQAQSLGDVSGETVACLYWLGKEAQDG
jgi:tetratricopeptide (TPR) repeat protein